jgi:glycosyltransferase involved in cell wall biosynthesis
MQTSRRRIVYMGRLHSIKGLDLLMRAWAAMQDRSPGVELLVVGDGKPDDRRHLDALVRQLGLRSVRFQPPVSGTAKDAILAEASLLVLPSHSENFGMVVAEALSAGVPVAASSGTPWQGLTEHRCGWWLERNVEDWAEALVSAATMPESDLRVPSDPLCLELMTQLLYEKTFVCVF